MESCLMGAESEVRKMKGVLVIHGSDGCPTLQMYLMPLSCTIKIS